MLGRITAAIAATFALAVTGLTVGVASASTTAPETFRHTVRVTNNVDNGAHGYWAWINYDRTVRITKTADGGDNAADTYRVALTDTGSLKTIPGARSPKDGVRIDRAVEGTFSGNYEFSVTSTTPPRATGVQRGYDFACQLNGTGKRADDCRSMPQPTDAWPKLYFDNGTTGFTVTPGIWNWSYRTCAERRTDGSAGDHGDITGKRCDADVTPAEPTVVQPACTATRGVLTIPSVRGVTYSVAVGRQHSRTWSAGPHNVLPGTYRVTATALDGYQFPRGADRTWKLVVNKPTVCPTPTPTPTASPSPTPTSSPSPSPSVTPAAVTPKAPVVEQSTCATEGVAHLVIPSVEGVVYSGVSGVVKAGTYTVKPGEVVVSAKAAEGFVLADGSKAEWTLTVNDPPPSCPGPAGADGADGVDGKVVTVGGVKVPTRIDTGLGGTA